MLYKKLRMFLGLSLLAVGTLSAADIELTPKEKELLERSTAEYRAEVYPPEIPRAFDVHRVGCPVCGEAINKHGRWAWIIDYKKPFKVQCPECKTIFPDNDFEAYWKSGFKDKSLLTGKYVDDGWGWQPAEGEPKYWFVAFYVHWRFWRDKVFRQLSDAYVRTGNPAFARRCLAMLDKYAEYYPYYDHNKQSRYATEVNHAYTGRILNMIWEALATTELANSYSKVADILAQPDAELEEVTGKTMAEIDANIKNNMFRTMANDIMSKNGRNRGNFGMHQRGLMKIAKILNDPEMTRWVTDFRPDNDMAYTPLDYAIFSLVFGDGAPMEAPGYNSIWLNTIFEMAILLKENGVEEFEKYPTLHHVYNYATKLLVCGKFTQNSGDTGVMSSIGFYGGNKYTYDNLYKMYPTPNYARMLIMHVLGNKELVNELWKTANPMIGYESCLLGSYGFASLQNGYKPAPTAAVLSFPNYLSHRHCDQLHFEIFAEDAPMMPDFGYPDSASADDPERSGFYENTVSHNTVVVDRHKQAKAWARALCHDTKGFAKRMSAESPAAYNLPLYRRNIMTIEIAPGKTIFYDVFRVKGGKVHDWFMHSAGEDFFSNIEFSEEEPGTFAGPDVPYGDIYDSPTHKNMTGSSRNYGDYRGSGYQYLTNVRRGKVAPGCQITMPVMKGGKFSPLPGAALRMYPLEGSGDIAISHGMPPRTQKNTQKYVVFITRTNIGENNLESVFPTIYETLSDERKGLEIVSAEAIPAPAGVTAAKVVIADSRELYLFDAEKSADFTYNDMHFCGQAGALLLNPAEKKGQAYVSGKGFISMNDNMLVESAGDFVTKVSAVGLDEETITFEQPVPESFNGRAFRIGDFAYTVQNINGNTVKLLDRSTFRGRFRCTGHNNDNNASLNLAPPQSLARAGMALYSSDKQSFVGRILKNAPTSIKADADLELNVDYWISECGPGDEAIFPGSAVSSFEF